MKHKPLIVIGVVVGALVLFVVIELLVIKYNGTEVAVPNTPRTAETYGSKAGLPLVFVVMGDSTSVGQGGDYDQGIARSSARYLGQWYQVTMYNVGVSGARTADVRTKQLPKATELRPDVVLLAIGANDVTHFTSTAAVRSNLTQTIAGLQAANPAVRIILTGSPPMGTVPRFPQPIRALAGQRTTAINEVFDSISSTTKQVTFAHIADETAATFAARPELFAQDNFHPTAEGYQVWMPVLQRAYDASAQK